MDGSGRVTRPAPHRGARAAVAVAVVSVLAAVGCASSTSSTAPGSTPARPDTAGLVDLGNGRSIHLECRGSGGPTVILVTGLGERADNFLVTSADRSSE